MKIGRARERGLTLGRKDLFDLTGKVAVVTGSTKGIGRAMAEGLADAGATIVVSSRKQDLCEEVAEQIHLATGSKTVGMACHVGDWEQVPHFLDIVMERLGRIDILVNNAGINPARTTIEEMSLDLWRKVFTVNLEGPLRTSQLVAPIMRGARRRQHHQYCEYGWVLGRRPHFTLLRIEGGPHQPDQKYVAGVGALECSRKLPRSWTVYE